MPVAIYQLGLSAWYLLSIGFLVSIAGSLTGLVAVVWILMRVFALRYVRGSMRKASGKVAASPHDYPDSQRAATESLNERLGGSTLKSSARILILVLLSVHKRMSLVELGKFTGLGRSSLGNHLQKLEAAGYTETKVARTFGGRRQVIEITRAGLEDCRMLLDTVRSIRF